MTQSEKILKFYLYCRKSTEESAGKQLNSLESQEQAMRQIAESEGLEIVKVFRESQSASKLGRPVLEQMLSEIEQGKAEGILCWKLDRLARNMVEGGAIYQMLQDEKIKKIKCYDKEYDKHTNAIVFGVELGQATQYSVELRANVRRGMLFKLRSGHWPTMAPIGYLNYRENGISKMVIDKEKAPLIQELFQEFSKGTYPLRDIAEHMYQRGLTTKAGKKIHIQKIADILDNPIYYGLMNWQGESVIGKHEPIISKELFDKVQDIRHNKSRPRLQKHFFQFRGLFTCSECGCSITPEKQKNFHYYHCTDGKKLKCKQKSINIREEDLIKELSRAFSALSKLDNEMVEIMYEASLEKLGIEDNTNLIAKDNLEKLITKLEEKKTNLLSKNLNEIITDSEYLEMKKDIEKEIQNHKISLKNLEKEKDPLATLERTKQVFLDSNRAKYEFLKAKPEQRRELVFNLLSNATVKERKMANYQYKSPYNIIARTPVPTDFSSMWTRQDSNLLPLPCKGSALPGELRAQFNAVCEWVQNHPNT